MFKMKEIVFVLLIVMIIFISGCTSIQLKEPDKKSIAVARCVELCNWERNHGRDLSTGPCLSNNITEDWVCDVAHDPRINIDNLPQNQCNAWKKTASHFVEVSPQCKLIRYF